MITLIPDLPGKVLGFEVSGTVTAEDYESVIMPAVDAASAGDSKLRLLYHVTPQFEKYELGAMWDDAKLGLQHLTSWEKVAVVTDVEWISSGIRVFGFAIPGEFRSFANTELAEAKSWLLT